MSELWMGLVIIPKLSLHSLILMFRHYLVKGQMLELKLIVLLSLLVDCQARKASSPIHF